MSEVVTKALAENLVGGIDCYRKELERAREELVRAQRRVEEQEAKYLRGLTYLALLIEGVPTDKLKSADDALPQAGQHKRQGSDE